MAHEIETTAWANERPWHGLGTEVKSTLSAEQMLKAAKLDWEVEKQPVHTKLGSGTQVIPDYFALVRSSDHRVLDIVGKQYTPCQNHQAFKFFKEFVEAGKAKMETAGSLKNGRMVWGLANLGESFKLKGNDEVKGYLLVASPHEQGRSLQIKFTAVRVVCNNTLTMALSTTDTKNIFRMAHRKEFTDEMITKAKDTLGIARETFDDFQKKSEALQKIKASEEEAIRYFQQVFDPELKNASIQELRSHPSKPIAYALQALQHAPGASLPSSKGTAWGLLNAVTYTTDHLLGRSNDGRLSKAWFGTTETLKQKAFVLAQQV